MARKLFIPVPAGTGQTVRLDTASGSSTPASDLRTLAKDPIPGALLKASYVDGSLPKVLGPDGVSTLYQKTLDPAGAPVGAVTTLTGVDAGLDPAPPEEDADRLTYSAVTRVGSASGDTSGVADTAAVLAAIARAPVGGVVQYNPGETYYQTNVVSTKSVIVDGNGANLVVDPTPGAGNTGDPAFWFKGSVGTRRAFGAPCVANTKTVTLDFSGYTDFAVGDFVIVKDDNAVISKWDGSGTAALGISEINVVTGVAGATITLAKPLEFSYQISAASGLVKMNPLIAPQVRGFASIHELPPGSDYSGGVLTGNVPHIIHFQYCVANRVSGCNFVGWNVHAISEHYCFGGKVDGNQGELPYYTTSGVGIFHRLNFCSGSVTTKNVTKSVRHLVDWVTSYDGRSSDNYGFDAKHVQFVMHGLRAKRCKSTDDHVIGSTVGGWVMGNSTFGPDFGFTITNPSYFGDGYPIVQGALAEDMWVTNPDIHSSLYGIRQDTGAKRLKVLGGRVEIYAPDGTSYAVASKGLNANGDLTSVAPQDISVRGLTMTGSTVVDVTDNTGTVDLDTYLAPRSEVPLLGHGIAGGQETISRVLTANSATATSGQALWTFFTARKARTVSNVKTSTRGTAAATTTLARVGLYSVAANGDLTLLAATTNDTAMWAGTFTAYTKALSASVTLVPGTRYALAVLFVGTTPPALYAHTGANIDANLAPRLVGHLTGQTDLPASATEASLLLASTPSMFYALLT